MEGVKLFITSFVFSRFGAVVLIGALICVIPKLWNFLNEGLRRCR